MTVHISLQDPGLEHRHLLSALSTHVSKSKRTVIVTGAGISCNAGIPDFRSQDGLYNLVKEKYPKTVVKGKDLFDISLFSSPITTSVFYTFIASLRQSILSASATPTHKFIRTMHERGKLMRCYTQNIDGIETREGLVIGGKEAQVCQLHGDIHTLRCDYCNGVQKYTEEWMEMLLDGEAPDCPICVTKCELREARGKRALKIGTLLPNIVLYNDPTPHPSTSTTSTVISADLSRKPDLLLIFGTSLKVHGIKKLVREFAKNVHANKGVVVLVNRDELSRSEWQNHIDYWVEGDCDSWVHDMKTRIPHLWMKQESLPVMPVIKPHSRKPSVVDLTLEDDKENKVPSTPQKSASAAFGVGNTSGSPRPLSPSKRGLNANAPESPTKRLQTSMKALMVEPPPKMMPVVAISTQTA